MTTGLSTPTLTYVLISRLGALGSVRGRFNLPTLRAKVRVWQGVGQIRRRSQGAGGVVSSPSGAWGIAPESQRFLRCKPPKST